MDKSCSNCKYFKYLGENTNGECHRYPPVYSIQNNKSKFPPVPPTEMCGEHKLIPKSKTR